MIYCWMKFYSQLVSNIVFFIGLNVVSILARASALVGIVNHVLVGRISNLHNIDLTIASTIVIVIGLLKFNIGSTQTESDIVQLVSKRMNFCVYSTVIGLGITFLVKILVHFNLLTWI